MSTTQLHLVPMGTSNLAAITTITPASLLSALTISLLPQTHPQHREPQLEHGLTSEDVHALSCHMAPCSPGALRPAPLPLPRPAGAFASLPSSHNQASVQFTLQQLGKDLSTCKSRCVLPQSTKYSYNPQAELIPPTLYHSCYRTHHALSQSFTLPSVCLLP